MIGSLKGTVELIDGSEIILDVNGVGYRVLIPATHLSKIVSGQKLHIFIYTHVREDVLELFGFPEIEDLKIFEYLISVSGIGPKTGISIFSFGSRSEIIEAVVKGDVEFFTRVPRLGRKNAQKIIIELKNKFGSLEELDLSGNGSADKDELMAVLKNLGFTPLEARDAIKSIDPDLAIEEKVKLALKFLGR